MLKKLSIAILIFFCSMNIISCGSSNNTDNMVFDIKYNNFMSDIASDSKGNIYIADKDNILVYDIEGKKQNTINMKDSFITNLCIDQNNIFAIDIFNKKIFELNQKGEILSQKQFNIEFNSISKIGRVANTLIVLGSLESENKDNPSLSLFKYDQSNNTFDKINIDGVLNFCTFKEDSLLLLSKTDKYEFTVYNIDKAINESLELNINNIMNTIFDFEYDEKANKIYYLSKNALDTSINSIKIDDGTKDIIQTIKNDTHSNQKRLILCNNYILCLNAEKLSLERYGKEKSSLNSNLIICSNSFSTLITKKFEKENNVEVTQIPTDDLGDRDKFVLKILSGDVDFDIYEINSSTVNSYSLIANGVFYDLSQSTIIKNYIDNDIIDFAKANSYYNNKIIGVPISAFGRVLYYNNDLLKKYNIELNDTYTWEEFIDVIDKIIIATKNPDSIYIDKSSLKSDIFNQYLYYSSTIDNANISYNDDKLKEVLVLLKKIEEDKYIKSVNRELPKGFNNYLLATFYSGVYDKTNKIPYSNLPKLKSSEALKNPITMSWLSVNPNSKNKDLAIKYLETLCQEDSLTQGVSQYTVLKKDILEKGIYINPEISNCYKKVSNNGVVMFEYSIYKSISPILSDFLSNNITIDAAANQINQKIDMIIKE